MAVVSVTGPADQSICAAYNPVVFVAHEDGVAGYVPPIVYCDVYFAGKFYKTLTSTSPQSIVGVESDWSFDIQGLAQEYIQSKLPDITNEDISLYPAEIIGEDSDPFGFVETYCKFRTSTKDVYGIITPEADAPVQGTVDSDPVDGDGFFSGDFVYIYNSALQWNSDKSDFEKHLQDFQNDDINTSPLGYTLLQKIYPLSHLKGSHFDPDSGLLIKRYSHNTLMHKTDYGVFPFLTVKAFYWDGAIYGSAVNVYFRVDVWDETGNSVFFEWPADPVALDYQKIYSLATGLKNLIAIFPDMEPFVIPGYYYRVSLMKFSGGMTPHAQVLFATPIYEIADPAEHARIYFRNYLGQLDAINFRENNNMTKVTSDAKEQTDNNGFTSAALRQVHGVGRNNVRSTDFSEITDNFQEGDMPLVKELLANSLAYIEIDNPDGDEPDRILLPIVIIDSEIETLRYEERYEYRVTIKYRMSHDNRTVR